MQYLHKVIDINNSSLITLEDMKRYLRVSEEYDDALIEGMLKSAYESAEQFMRIAVRQQKVLVSIDLLASVECKLPIVPAMQLLELTINSEILENIQECNILGEVLLLPQRLPLNSKVEFKYIAGFEDNNVPASIIQGIMIHVAYMYDKGGYSSIPPEAISFYQNYRKILL